MGREFMGFVLELVEDNITCPYSLSIGFGEIFLECYPVDIRAMFSRRKAITTREEQVLLVW